mgnify:CR=1 FL=1
MSLAGLVQPRLEPEIVFGFAAAPRAGPPKPNDPPVRAAVAGAGDGTQAVHAGQTLPPKLRPIELAMRSTGPRELS